MMTKKRKSFKSHTSKSDLLEAIRPINGGKKGVILKILFYLNEKA